MHKFARHLLLVSPALLVSQLFSAPASAEPLADSLIAQQVAPATDLEATPVPDEMPSVDEFLQQSDLDALGSSNSIDQVTSVSQLRDVQPTDWAFQALQSLVERYGCIAGYPDGTFRGNRPLTRYEFAAGLNACLDRITELIGPDGIDEGTMSTIRRLQEEFQAELATLRGRVDALEARTAELEANQFSTTTKLQGEVVFGIADTFGGDAVTETGEDDSQTVFQQRVRLNFVTSFTGKDTLYTRLDMGNATFFNLDQGAFTYSFDSENRVELGWLAYYFPIGDNIQVYLPAAFPLYQDFVPTISPYLEGFTGASNAISSYAESSPIYKIGLASGGGLGINFELGDWIMLSGGYFGGDSNSPFEKQGLFNGEYSALGQITLNPGGKFQLGLTYVNAYFNDTGSDNGIFDLGVGTGNATQPFGSDAATITNSYGAAASLELSPKFVINAYGGFTDAEEADGTDEAEIWYYGLGLAFPDFGGEGNLLGLVAGAEPYVGGFNNSSSDSVADDTALHVEGFYRFALNDNISITPGAIWLTAPNGEEDFDDVIIGTIRTTFTF